MNQRTDFSDSELSAWLDGEGSAEERERIEAHLRHDEQAAAKVRLWSADRDALRARFDPVRSEDIPTRLADTVANGKRWSGRWLQAAVAAGLLVGGGIVGSVRFDRPAADGPTILAEVGISHAVCIAGEKHLLRVQRPRRDWESLAVR